MIGNLTKKFTARVFTLWFHCGPFPLHGSMVSPYHVVISVLSSPLPTHFHNHRPQQHLLSDIWPCACAQHVECFSHVKRNKLGFHSTLSSQTVRGRRQNSLLLVFCPCGLHPPCNAVYKYSDVHCILLHITATKNEVPPDRRWRFINSNA